MKAIYKIEVENLSIEVYEEKSNGQLITLEKHTFDNVENLIEFSNTSMAEIITDSILKHEP